MGDVGRTDLGFNREKVVVGNDQHDRFARGYGAAYRVNREFMHCAGLGGANVDTPQQILRGNFSFGELRQLGPHLCQLLRALAPHVLINLDDLLLHFGDFALSLGNGCNELSLLSTEFWPLPAQVQSTC